MKRVPKYPRNKTFSLTFKDQKQLVEIDKTVNKTYKKQKLDRFIFTLTNRPIKTYDILFSITKESLLDEAIDNQSSPLDIIEDFVQYKMPTHLVTVVSKKELELTSRVLTAKKESLYIFKTNFSFVICRKKITFPSKATVTRRVNYFLGVETHAKGTDEVFED